jgi:hypothetical protein
VALALSGEAEGERERKGESEIREGAILGMLPLLEALWRRGVGLRDVLGCRTELGRVGAVLKAGREERGRVVVVVLLDVLPSLLVRSLRAPPASPATLALCSGLPL